MIDETYRARWAWLFAWLGLVGAVAIGCSANEPGDSGNGDNGGSGMTQGGVAGTPSGGTPATGGSPPLGGTGQGGTGSGGVSGTPATGGSPPLGGTAGVGGSAGSATGGVPTGGAPTGGAPTGGAAGDGGTGGGGATLVEPILRGSNYVLEFGDLYFEVSPNGARVVNVHLTGGQNLLTDATINATNYGSTFWTAPQSEWDWPPVPEIDSGPYAPTVTSPSVYFLSSAATIVPARVAKTFRADLAKVAIVADYSIQATTAAHGFAPWEITRVFKRGLTFWPTGTTPRAGTMPILPTTTGAGCTWHEATASSTEGKLFANAGAGWLAHVDGDTVIVKKFPDIMPDQAAPGEDEIEIYVGTGNYIEVEQQGAYQMLPMGMSFTWSVTWFVKKLPQGVTASVGNEDLVAFVQSLVQ
jgi:hypothetical protein